MRILLIAVGKIKERGLRDAIDDYKKRIGRYARIEEIEIKDGDDDAVAARLRKAIPERAHVVAMEVDGKAWSSHDLAAYVDRCENGSVAAVAFLIGGSYGLPKDVSKAAQVRLSLSAMILPHRIARLVLAEQIYRAFTISRGEPYSH